MSSYNNGLLSPASEEDAEYVEIACSGYGCRVTEGQIYKLERNCNNPHIFEYGEAYIIDDDNKDNYAVLMLCKTNLYK